jgi:hypothetical protein
MAQLTVNYVETCTGSEVAVAQVNEQEFPAAGARGDQLLAARVQRVAKVAEWIQLVLVVGLLGLVLLITLQGANEYRRRAQPIARLVYFENQVSGDTLGGHRIVLSDGRTHLRDG